MQTTSVFDPLALQSIPWFRLNFTRCTSKLHLPSRVSWRSLQASFSCHGVGFVGKDALSFQNWLEIQNVYYYILCIGGGGGADLPCWDLLIMFILWCLLFYTSINRSGLLCASSAAVVCKFCFSFDGSADHTAEFTVSCLIWISRIQYLFLVF
jgi:hypothetical protein